MDCADKLKFNRKDEADEKIRQERLLRYEDSEGLNSYYCKKHSCWHIGHSNENPDDNSRISSINRTLNRIDESKQERKQSGLNKKKNKR